MPDIEALRIFRDKKFTKFRPLGYSEERKDIKGYLYRYTLNVWVGRTSNGPTSCSLG